VRERGPGPRVLPVPGTVGDVTEPSPGTGPADGPDADEARTSPTPSGGPGQPVQYKGADLDPARGPGLGCFWIQIALFVVFVILTPVSVSLGWPSVVSAALLIVTLGLLFFAGQTVIFLLRLVAADRREGRRRPMASSSKTVGELEDERRDGQPGEDPSEED
jgi:hypothetical protein